MKNRFEKLTVILFCSLLALLSVAFLVMPDRAFSEQENRNLQQSPELTKDSFFSGQFAKDINVYFADQFPLRDLFVRIKSGSELAFLKGENNGVLYSKDQLAVKDFMAYRSIAQAPIETDRIYLDSVRAQTEAVERLGQTLDVPLVTVLPPRTIDIADSVFSYDRPDGDAVFDIFDEVLTEKAGYIDVLGLLRPKYESGEYVYYKTDHHWTTLGAYYVYCEIMTQLGKADSIIPKDEFEIEYVLDFSGTTAGKASFPIYAKDTLELWHLPDDNEYLINSDGVDENEFYEREFLDKSDKYSVFFGGTKAVTTITLPDADRETLLIAKDSFANSLIPFLAREFDIVALNLSSSTFISTFAEVYEADAVLVVFNVENIITTGHLGKLK
ncbi:MAG: hypothetical protein IKK70_02295 [Clostridia bacterium]|nr:hypothetical protein [Clostridia bacterium]